MGVKGALLCAALAAAGAAPASAETTRFDALRGCERFGAMQLRRHNSAFRRFQIDRPSVNVDRFADKVGNQYVSAVYSGQAVYDGGSGPTTVRFVCLHGGIGKGPLFVYTLAD